MIRYEQKKEKHTCYGCRACEQICPKGAIRMTEDKEGFLYPLINKEMCINCSLCGDVCPYERKEENSIGKTYAAQIKDADALMESASGGAFSWMANYVVQNNGYVSGCIFDDNLKPIHIVTNDKEDLVKMHGSKYVQSDMKSIYSEIELLLKNNQLVLFTGTPCQVAGLKGYLRKSYDKLITMDLICHGVPSSKLFLEYIKAEKRKGKNIQEIKFRDKKMNGWCSQGSIAFNGKKKNISPFNNSYYYYYYLGNYVSRYSCYTCKYSSMERPGDITIGDCWNVRDDLSDIDTAKGFSAIIINSVKGQQMFEKLKNNITYYPIDKEFLISNNGNLQEPCKMPEKRKVIYEEIARYGYEVTEKKECKYQYVVPFIRKHTPKKVKDFIRKIKKV